MGLQPQQLYHQATANPAAPPAASAMAVITGGAPPTFHSDTAMYRNLDEAARCLGRIPKIREAIGYSGYSSHSVSSASQSRSALSSEQARLALAAASAMQGLLPRRTTPVHMAAPESPTLSSSSAFEPVAFNRAMREAFEQVQAIKSYQRAFLKSSPLAATIAPNEGTRGSPRKRRLPDMGGRKRSGARRRSGAGAAA